MGLHVANEYQSVEWDDATENECRWLIERAREEDLAAETDWTSRSVTRRSVTRRSGKQGKPTFAGQIVSRQAAVICGLRAWGLIREVFEADVEMTEVLSDGTSVEAGDVVASLSGNAFDLLCVERTLLNLVSHLTGIASLTREYVHAVEGTKARIYDTRKTLPGWRRLQKFAVRMGGGFNHRLGLFDGILIKDNHVALVAREQGCEAEVAAGMVVELARREAESRRQEDNESRELPIEIEVDTLAQLRNVLSAKPDIVLLDNMSNEELRSAVAIRDEQFPDAVLEASGGVNLKTVGGIAQTGVDRISVGALTHSAKVADLGLDWHC